MAGLSDTELKPRVREAAGRPRVGMRAEALTGKR